MVFEIALLWLISADVKRVLHGAVDNRTLLKVVSKILWHYILQLLG